MRPYGLAVVVMCMVYMQCIGMLLERKYGIYLRDTRFGEYYARLEGVSRIRCCDACMTDVKCTFVSYNKGLSTCELTPWNYANHVLDAGKDYGWSVYHIIRDSPCPGNYGNFETVGSHSIAVCPFWRSANKARMICSRFGRLVQPETAEMFHEIKEYLSSLSVRSDMDIWTGGRYNHSSSSLTFDDGTPMPLDPELYDSVEDVDGRRDTCFRMKQSAGYLWNDKLCTNKEGFICEMP